MDWIIRCEVLFIIVFFCHSQNINYHCTFDDSTTTGCGLQLTSGFGINLGFYSGVEPSDKNPTEPLSDVTAVISTTVPNNEYCQFPYNHPSGNWSVYFCLQHSPNYYTCPTTSRSTAQCSTGRYAGIRAGGTGVFNQTYSSDSLPHSSNSQCLDFYYYIPDTLNNSKIEVGWSTNTYTGHIVELKALAENKWQHCQVNFMVEPAEAYSLTFKLTRDLSESPYMFGLDEIMVYDNFCGRTLEMSTLDTTVNTNEGPSSTGAIVNEENTADQATQHYSHVTTSVESITSSSTSATDVDMFSASSLLNQMTDFDRISTEKSPTVETTFDTSSSTSTVVTSTESSAVFLCDFSGSCFNGIDLRITNGSEFVTDDLTEPPHAPLSDVDSITYPTENNKTCKLPYNVPFNSSTHEMSYDMWFCYENQCETGPEEIAVCRSGTYGLITIESSESNKTIENPLKRNAQQRNLQGDYCLRYYYYFTIYNQSDWGQLILVSMQSDEPSTNKREIDRVEFDEMTNNSWHSKNISFTVLDGNYNIIFSFEVRNTSRSTIPTMNKTIYFGVDNIAIDRNLEHCRSTIPMETSGSSTEVTMITSPNLTTIDNLNETDPSNNLKLILGLSLGISIPVIFGIMIFAFRCYLSKGVAVLHHTLQDIPLK